MIRDLTTLQVGQYIADFRSDEGVRIREGNISPCITTPTGGGVSHMILIIEVLDESTKRDKTGLD